MASASRPFVSWRPLPSLLRHSPSCQQAEPAQLAVISALTPSIRSQSELMLEHKRFRSSFCAKVRLKNSGPNSGPKRARRVTPTAGMRLDPGGNNSNDGGGGVGRVVVNLVLAGGLTYLTLTGKLGWVFDTIFSLWLLAVLIPVVVISAFLWFAEREIVRGACPNCGQEFQVFEFAVKEQQNLCPYCIQPFKLDMERQFVRDEPYFSNQQSGGFKDGFGDSGRFGRKTSTPKDPDIGGVIVDVEAEVVDRD